MREDKMMTFAKYRFQVLSDLYRVSGDVKKVTLLRNILFGESYKFIFWMRTCKFLQGKKIFKYSVYPFALLFYNHYRYRYGIAISFESDIGPGFYIGHFGGIVVYPLSQIGKNCNLSHGVTLGITQRGKNKGYPRIGDNVYIGPGAKIIGSVKIGNHVAIGANCVVTQDVPDNAVVVGIPGKVISYEGSLGYVNNTDYDRKIR